MDVILRADVAGLGQRGEIVSVAPGYFRNYLSPKGLGYKATKGAEAEAQAMRRASELKDEESRAGAEEIATRLVPQVITISAKTADGGTLFGSVAAADIAAAVEAQADIEIDRKAFRLDAPLKTLGQHMVMTRLHSDVQFPVTVEIVAED